MDHRRKAVALISGGLDSMLAARIVMDAGIHVEGINFFTGFCVEGHTHAIRKQDRDKAKRNNALWVAEQLGIKLHIIDVIDEYKQVVLNPEHGYGAHMNPCLDCKVFMVGHAQQWADDNGFDFIITGEVMGQRPKSQMKALMPLIARESGAQDRLLRPLSGKHLPETLPEREGWIRRDQLYGFHGRNRKPQIALAESLGFEDWAQPSGGCCFLTDKSYSAKLKDLFASRSERDYELDDVMLLKMGRHLRPRPNFKVIISREDGENRYLSGYRRRYLKLEPSSHGGPVALIDGDVSEADITLAARLVARYSQGKHTDNVTIALQQLDGTFRDMNVTPLPTDEIPDDWYL